MRTQLSRRITAIGALALTAVIGAGSAAPAAAASGQWWYDTYQVEKNQSAGWTGEGVKIAVIDEQINPDLPVFSGTTLTVAEGALCEGRSATSAELTPGAGHGSNVTALLIGNGDTPAGTRGIVPGADVTFYGYGPEPEGSQTNTCQPPPEAQEASLSQLGWGIRRAMEDGADIISMSFGLYPEPGDDDVIAEALARGVVLVGSVYNGGSSIAETQLFPWSYRGVIAVNAMDANGTLVVDTNWGIPHTVSGTTVVAAGVDVPIMGSGGDWSAVGTATGSSFATPLVAGMLAATSQKYPKASGNQLIQSLIRNTGSTDHELEFNDADGYGYGLASLTHMLSVDPTQYEDENPLLDKSYMIVGSDYPTDEQLAAARAALPSPTPSATDAPAAEPAVAAQSTDLSGVIITIGVVVVVLAAAAVITIVVVRNNRKNRSRSPQ